MQSNHQKKYDKSNPDIAELLINYGADVNFTEINGVSPLYFAAQHGHKDVVELLITHGANVHWTWKGSTPLLIAAGMGYKDIAELLIKGGAHVNSTANNGAFPLFVAAENGHKDVVELLINHWAETNKLKDQKTAFFQAVLQKKYEVVRYMLQSGKLNLENEVAVALKNDNRPIARQIIDIFPQYSSFYPMPTDPALEKINPDSFAEAVNLAKFGCDILCSICLNTAGFHSARVGIDGNPIPAVSITQCGHTYCSNCLSRWLREKQECPNCKHELPDSKTIQFNPRMWNVSGGGT